MAAAATDKLMEVGIATATTLDANYTINDTSITVASTSGWPTATGVAFAIDVVDSAGVQVPGTYNEYVGVVSSATSITSVDHMNGTDRNYSAGATTRVYIPVSTERENRIVEWGVVQHKQDGTHADTITTDTINENTSANGVTIDGLNIKDSKLTTANSVVTANVTDAAITPAKLSSAVGEYEVLANVTLGGAADSISSGTFTAKRFLRVIIDVTHTGAASGNLTFNGDTGNNYSLRYSTSGAFGTGVSTNQIGAIFNNNATGASGGVVDIVNRSNAPKHGTAVGSEATTNAATASTGTVLYFKWTNNSAAITSMTLSNGAAGDYDAGSRLIVLGTDF